MLVRSVVTNHSAHTTCLRKFLFRNGSSMNPPAAWHPDPYDPSLDRYWDGQQWTNQTRPKDSDVPTRAFAPVEPTSTPSPAGGKKRRKWPWMLGAGLVGFVALGATLGDGGASASNPGVSTTTSSADSTTTTTTPPPTTSSRAPSISPSTQTQTTTPYARTTQAAPAPTTTSSLEYSCSDAAWRESMGTEGDELCGAPWTPRNRPQPPMDTAPSTPENTVPPPATQFTPPPPPQSPSVSYENCKEARAAGAAPILRGEPGYGTHLDRDKDGIACDE